MTSPFPGMDPYLEGYLWPDVHNELASAIKSLLAPQIAPKYVARIDLYTVDDTSPEAEIGIMYPDMGILQRRDTLRESRAAYAGSPLTPTEPTVVIPSGGAIPVRIPVVEIRDAAKNLLVTAIEILSPVNKKKPGLDQYREKRQDLHRKGVHLIEIDLLRRGTRPFIHPSVPDAHYLVTLMRSGTQQTQVWAMNVQDALPVLPVPLLAPDPDVMLDLKGALDLIYARSLYQLSIDYDKDPPPPAFAPAERAWMRNLTK